MFRIRDTLYNGTVSLHSGEYGAYVEALFDEPPADEDLAGLKNAKELEDLEMNYGEVSGVRGVYALCGWKSIENTRNGVRICWQTYNSTDIENIKDAIFELAAIIGGGNG